MLGREFIIYNAKENYAIAAVWQRQMLGYSIEHDSRNKMTESSKVHLS
ncbi:hypothetical protein [Streptococcus cuniculi]|nr:hypothetical protein [Streptococcus cuniculi]